MRPRWRTAHAAMVSAADELLPMRTGYCRVTIEYSWQSGPRLWMAMRENYCGCAECICRYPAGFGKTKEEAAADLIEKADESLGDENHS
jgi:hypothetical protein